VQSEFYACLFGYGLRKKEMSKMRIGKNFEQRIRKCGQRLLHTKVQMQKQSLQTPLVRTTPICEVETYPQIASTRPKGH